MPVAQLPWPSNTKERQSDNEVHRTTPASTMHTHTTPALKTPARLVLLKQAPSQPPAKLTLSRNMPAPNLGANNN
jgi:hypothetical protein